jgi:hypothetical protein
LATHRKGGTKAPHRFILRESEGSQVTENTRFFALLRMTLSQLWEFLEAFTPYQDDAHQEEGEGGVKKESVPILGEQP